MRVRMVIAGVVLAALGWFGAPQMVKHDATDALAVPFFFAALGVAAILIVVGFITWGVQDIRERRVDRSVWR